MTVAETKTWSPHRVLKRLTYTEKSNVPTFRWCVVDARGQTVFIGSDTDRTSADERCAALNSAERERAQ